MSLPVPDAAHVAWLGAAGTGTAFGLLSSMRERYGASVRVVAADIFPPWLVAASHLADAFEQVPPVADAAFVDQLLAGLSRHGVDTYIPILDEEILLAAEWRERGTIPARIVVVAPPAESARICLDKLLTARWLMEHGVPTPCTLAPADVDWRGQPWIAKPRRGRGSVGVQLVRTEAELRALAGRADLVLQQVATPPEVTVDAFLGGDGRFRAVCRERLEVKAGVCTKARVFEDDRLCEIASLVGRGLQLRGAFCVQVMRDGSRNDWVVTDVNARPGAGTRMTVAAGVDLLGAALSDAWQLEPVPLPPLTRERYVVRQYTEYVA